jgi:hypothetical protein
MKISQISIINNGTYNGITKPILSSRGIDIKIIDENN